MSVSPVPIAMKSGQISTITFTAPGCGTVRNVPLEYHHDADRDVAEASGYLVFRHRTVFEGLCPKCQERKRGLTAPETALHDL